MASDNSEFRKVSTDELYNPAEDALAGAPAVKVAGLEEDKPSGPPQESSTDEETSTPVTHETDKVKTTYDEQDDGPNLSTKAKIKDKLIHLGDKLRSKEAVDAKNSDPHPGLE